MVSRAGDERQLKFREPEGVMRNNNLKPRGFTISSTYLDQPACGQTSEKLARIQGGVEDRYKFGKICLCKQRRCQVVFGLLPPELYFNFLPP
jgi:hypothetical protein